jgi:hypothetical protein
MNDFPADVGAESARESLFIRSFHKRSWKFVSHNSRPFRVIVLASLAAISSAVSVQGSYLRELSTASRVVSEGKFPSLVKTTLSIASSGKSLLSSRSKADAAKW